MKLDLMESGLQNIRSLAKQYNKAIIYFHVDLDGVTSCLSAKFYLAKYGIETVEQYNDILNDPTDAEAIAHVLKDCFKL